MLFLPFLLKHGDSFLNPYFKKNIFFVLKRNNKTRIFQKIEYLLNINKKNWEQKLEKSNIRILFDKKNSILKKEVFKIMNNIKKDINE